MFKIYFLISYNKYGDILILRIFTNIGKFETGRATKKTSNLLKYFSEMSKALPNESAQYWLETE